MFVVLWTCVIYQDCRGFDHLAMLNKIMQELCLYEIRSLKDEEMKPFIVCLLFLEIAFNWHKIRY